MGFYLQIIRLEPKVKAQETVEEEASGSAVVEELGKLTTGERDRYNTKKAVTRVCYIFSMRRLVSYSICLIGIIAHISCNIHSISVDPCLHLISTYMGRNTKYLY